MFEHTYFDHYGFEEIPQRTDLWLIDERDMATYERCLLSLFEGGDYDPTWLASPVSVRDTRPESLELACFFDVHTRFHEVSVTLPRSEFVRCVGSWQYDEKPRVFVRSAWLESLYQRAYSVFALVDADGVTQALRSGLIGPNILGSLRDRIDDIASRYDKVSFISFADSILLKSNWWPGYYPVGRKSNYEPEVLIEVCEEIDTAYRTTLGLGTYAVLTQGSNEYYDDALLHISDSGNHVSLNSLGVPFAQLQEIELTARRAVRSDTHPKAELYMDSSFLNSLDLDLEFNKKGLDQNGYGSKTMSSPGRYYLSSRDTIRRSIRPRRPAA